MFRSRRTFDDYQRSLQNETATYDDPLLDDIDGEEDNVDEVAEENDENVEPITDIDPALMPVLEGFNDDEEVLVLDGQGSVSKLRGRITVRVVLSLDVSSRVLVPLNKFLQPVKKAGGVFNRFLADVAKRPRFCPLNYKDWRLVPSLFKDRIMNYIRKKFVLPSNRTVDEKVLSSIGESLRGYKRSLRMKYIKEGTTKEELYALPAAESGNSEGLTRPYGVGDTMWYGFVDLCFSDKFQKYSEIGKKARAKQLHPHTNGSQSFAILRDQFERKHNREPGPIEWFIETRQNKKDKTFHDPITEQFVDKAKNIIKKKTGSSEVVFSESTFQAEDIAYQKLMGSESHGKVWGLGHGVTARDMRNLRHQAESPLIMKLMKKMQNLENQVDVLNAKLATQASATQPELSTHFQEASRHNTTRDHYISHNSPLSGNGSHEASRLDTVHDQYRSNESPKSGDALSISNVLGNQTHKLARSSKQGNNPRKTIVSGENALSKPSSGNVGLGSLNNGGQHRSPLQHNSTLLNAGGVGPKPMEPSSSIRERNDMGINKQIKDTPIKSSTMVQKVSDEQGTAKQQEQTVMNSLSRAQVDILVSTVVKNHPKEVHQYRSSEKRELIVYYLAGVAIGICKRRAEPNMLDAALREKLDKLTLVMTKSKTHQVGVRNGDT